MGIRRHLRRVWLLWLFSVAIAGCAPDSPPGPSSVPPAAPPTSFTVSGTVKGSGIPVTADVDVISSVLGPLRVSAVHGRFTFYGLSGTVVIRAASYAHQPETKTVTVAGNTTVDFNLMPSTVPEVDLTGRWEITANAPSSCTGVLPAALTERRLPMTILQYGVLLVAPPDGTPSLSLVEPGYLIGRTMTLRLVGYNEEWCESIGASTLCVDGVFTGDAETDAVSGRIDGSFNYLPDSKSSWVTCAGADGAFRLRRSGS